MKRILPVSFLGALLLFLLTAGWSDVALLDSSVNVRDYGAVGDGESDDTVGVQAALTDGAGGTVYFPSGSYLVDGTLVVLDNTHIRLSSGCEIKLKDNVAGGAHTDAVFNSSPEGTSDNVVISGRGMINCNGAKQTYSLLKAIDVAGKGTTIEGITIIDATYGGIRCTTGCSDVLIRDVTLRVSAVPPARPFVTGIYINGNDALEPCGITVTDCRFIGNEADADCGDGIVTSYANNVFIGNNTFRHWGRTASSPVYHSYNIAIEHDGNDITIVGNTIMDPNSGGIVGKGNRLVIAGNSISGGYPAVGAHAINIATTDQFTCIDNVIQYPGGSAIKVGIDATAGVVIANLISGVRDRNSARGIYVRGGSAGVLIADNVICGSGGYCNYPAGICTDGCDALNLVHMLRIKGNRISHFDSYRGMFLADLGANSEVTGNTISDCAYAINLLLCHSDERNDILIADNSFSNIYCARILVESASQ